MRVCFFTKHEITWGSSRERVGIYLKFLKDRGHTYCIIYLFPNRLSRIWIGARDTTWLFRKLNSFWYSRVMRYLKFLWVIIIARRFDLIFIQKVNLPSLLLRLLRIANKNIVFDFDDLCFLTGEQRKVNIYQRVRLWWKFYQNPSVLSLFTHVIAGNQYLAEIVLKRRRQSNVSIVPTSIDCNLYFPAVKKNNSPLVIGFTGAGENHLRHLKLLTKPLDILGKSHTFVFKLVGAMYSDKIKSLFNSPNYEFLCIDWLSIEELAEVIRSFDIGVMPLLDDAQARGKCGFKALTYLASGLAAVVSPVGINQEIIRDGINGFLAEDESDWVDKLSILIRDGNLRDKFAHEGRKTVEESYSLSKNSQLFVDVIESSKRGL